ncbi:uncharacterized protein LOC127749655 [Frankliniella occidentalis]|uniref:Uncharacterized protein LOC127749655 n=1 Tax=Frankliniella occidentalis TaxID=133901 RepID=A0A9C6WWV3_FRAOC|nr:uncharacterized protein LOC127749655 [Frankliniella occidentalis]
MMDHAVGLAHAVELGRQCPAVRVLKLASLRADESLAVPVHPPRDAPFRRLEEFHLYSGAGPVLEYVLLHALQLRRVSVTPGLPEEAAPAWTDATLRRILDVNPLAELASFSLACPCELTMDSVYSLLLGCPKLRALFDLNEWAVSQQQMCELQELVAVNNWDLEMGLL